MNSTKIGIALVQKRKLTFASSSFRRLSTGSSSFVTGTSNRDSKRHLFSWLKKTSNNDLNKPENNLIVKYKKYKEEKTGLPWDQEKYGKKDFLEWEGGTTMPPQFRYTYLLLFVVLTTTHTLGKEARGRGGFLYDTWWGETFVSKLSKDRRERNRIYAIIHEIKAIEAAEIEAKERQEEADKALKEAGVFVPEFNLEEEIYFYQFPDLPLKGNEDIPIVKIPVFSQDHYF